MHFPAASMSNRPEYNLECFLDGLSVLTNGKVGWFHGSLKDTDHPEGASKLNADIQLAAGLISEEYHEFFKELTHNSGDPRYFRSGNEVDPAKLLKEAIDLEYVLHYFLGLFYGADIVEEARKRVHENNMLKLSTGTFREDGKLVKAPDHPKVDLSDLTVVMNYPNAAMERIYD